MPPTAVRIESANFPPHTMFSFFRRKKKPEYALPDPVEAPNKRMTLDERMAFRQEMLYQSIRETFLSMEVVGSMYKFKVMPVDERHHRFIAMIDVAKSFVTGREARTKSFASLERRMRASAYKRFGVLLMGTYWRVNETEAHFESGGHRKADITAHSTSTPPVDARATPIHMRTHPAHESVLARHGFQPVSDDEAQAFLEAMRSGLAPPVVHVGDMEYKSDLAPLDDGIMIGGTQYGRL